MNLESNRSSTCRDFAAFKRMYEKPAFVALNLFSNLKRFMNIVHEHHFAAERAAGRNSRWIRRAHHNHLGACTYCLGSKCGCYCVIAGANCRDANFSLLSVKTVDVRKCATRFERARFLQELQFAVYDRSVIEHILEGCAAQ